MESLMIIEITHEKYCTQCGAPKYIGVTPSGNCESSHHTMASYGNKYCGYCGKAIDLYNNNTNDVFCSKCGTQKRIKTMLDYSTATNCVIGHIDMQTWGYKFCTQCGVELQSI